MRALVLGARGAVGREVAARLRDAGDTVVAAGRTAPDGGVALDLATGEGLAQLARVSGTVDVVVNASGMERPEIAAHVGATSLVDISAAGSYLDALAEQASLHGARVLLGAGLAPGLSTLMAAEVAGEPGDEIDVMVTLGSGEAHGAAAVEWTSRLLGTDLHAPPEDHPVPNLRSWHRASVPGRRPRSYLRADFPDHVLIGRGRDRRIRSYLALSSPAATAALAVIARVPPLHGLLARVPQVGSERWHLLVTNRRTGRTLHATGEGQSRATGALAALAARRVVEDPPPVPTSMDQIIDWTGILGTGLLSRSPGAAGAGESYLFHEPR